MAVIQFVCLRGLVGKTCHRRNHFSGKAIFPRLFVDDRRISVPAQQPGSRLPDHCLRQNTIVPADADLGSPIWLPDA